MIRTEALTKFYGNRCAVNNLSVEIADCEIVGFLGLNGAGKTTTLRMLAGMLAPSSGMVEIDGQNMLATSSSDLRWRIGFLPERPPLYEDMTVRAYLTFAAKLRGYETTRVDARVTEVIDQINATMYADEAITNLSHGYRQRVGIGQAIIHEPSLVILDEPTSGLDPVQIVEMRNLISSLKEKHTVLLSSHNLPEISQTCDRLMVIEHGTLVTIGTEADLASESEEGARVLMEVVGDAAALNTVLTTLKSEEKIAQFERAERGEQLNEIKVHLSPALKETPEVVAQALFAAGLGLRKMQPMEGELESLFLKLTREKS